MKTKEYQALAKNVTGKTSMKEMTGDEAVKFIDALGPQDILLPLEGVSPAVARKEATNIALELSEYLGKPKVPPQIRVKSTVDEGLKSRVSNQFRGFIARSERLERTFLKMDGYIENGKMMQTFWNPVDRATDIKLSRVYGKMDEFRIFMADQGIDIKDFLSAKRDVVPGVSLTTGERMGVFLHSLNSDNRRHLIRGNGFTEDMINSVVASLTPQERSTAYWMFRHWQADTPIMASAYKMATGKNMKVVDNYVPIVIKGENIDLGDTLAKEAVFRFTGKHPSAKIKKGFTKARTGKAGQEMELDSVSLFLDRLPEAEHYKAFTPVIRDLQRIHQNPKFKAAMKNKPEYEVLGQWLKDVAATNPLKARDASSKLLRSMRVNATTAVLGFNITTALKQFPSFVTGMAEVGENAALKGMWSSWVDSKGTTELIKRLAPQIFKRSFEREIAEAKLMRSIEGRITDKLSAKETFMWLTTTMDKLVVKGLWRGGFDDALKKGFSEKMAAEYATRAIRRTQPFFSVKDIPEFYRSNEFMKALVMFTNQLNQNWNFYRHDIWGKTAAGQLSKGQAVRKTIEAFIIPSLMIGAITRSRPARDAGEFFKDLGSMAFSSVPVVGNFITSGMKGFRDNQGLVTTEILDKLQEGSYAAFQGEWDKVLQNIPELAGYAAGIPVSQPTRTIKAILDIASGKSDDWMSLIFGTYARKQASSEEKMKYRYSK